MRGRITKILSVDQRPSKGRLIPITTAEIEGQDIASGVGNFEVGQEVIAYFDDRYNKAKFQAVDNQHNAMLE